MNLYLIRTEYDEYSTNAENVGEATYKFNQEYPDYEIIDILEIDVESLVRLEDNDNIKFF